MSFVSGLLNQEITSIYSTSKNRYGVSTRTLSASNVVCRWQEKINRVLSASGEEVISTVECWVEPTTTISESYDIVKDSKTHKIVALTKHYGLSGAHEYTKLYLV